MDRQERSESGHDSQGVTAEHHCLLCEAEIEMDDYDIFFITGYCRFCHAALEEDE